MKLTQTSIDALLSYYKIVPIVGCFILGILLYEHMAYPWIIAIISGFVAIVISIKFRYLSFLLFIPLGLAFSANTQLISDDSIINYADEKIDLEGVLYKSPENREEGARLYINTNYVIRDGTKQGASGKVIIYSNQNNRTLSYGDRVRLLDIKLSEIENYRNPGAFNLKKFYSRQNIHLRGFTKGDEQIISFGLADSYSRVLSYIDSLRVKYGHFVRENFPSPQSGVLNAITIGEKRGIPPATREEFSKAGIAHVLAISGLHVGAVAIIFFFSIKWVLKRSEYLLLKFQIPRLAAALTILPVFLYTAVAGFSTSTVRAFIMISLYLLSIVIGRQEHRLNTLCAAALIILLWHPWSLFELSFQLSFSAVIAILLANKFYPFKFSTLEDKFYSLVKTTIAATLVTFPLVASSFGILPLISIPANLALLPLVEFVIIPISLMSFIVFVISPNIADPLMSLNIFFIEMFLDGVQIFLKIPYSSLTVPPMNTFSWFVFLLLALSLILNSSYPRIKYAIPLILIGFVSTLIYPLPGKSLEGNLAINILDVGDNKSVVLVELEDNRNILVDGGYSKHDRGGYIEKTIVTDYLLSRGIRRIDMLILSSTNKDNVSGADHLIEKFDVSKILTNGEKLSGKLWSNILEKEIEWINILSEHKISIGKSTLEIIRPRDGITIEDSLRPRPVVFRLSYMNTSFLFGESLEQEPFQKVLTNSYRGNTRSDVVFMPDLHLHGSLYKFIESVSPKIVVTKSKNIIPELSRVNLLDIENEGAITITSDGKELKVRSFLD